MKIIKRAFGEYLSPSKFVSFNKYLHCGNGRHHDVTCSCQKCYVKCGHNMINDMMLSTG